MRCGYVVFGGVLMAVAVASLAADEVGVKAITDRLVQEIDAAPNAGDRVKAFAKEHLVALCVNPVFVAAVEEQNARGTSLDEIKKLDTEWSEAEDELPLHTEKMGNACAREIQRLTADLGCITEMFVMDNQGANVGQNAMTSDYWQGDEPKWQNSYRGGEGGVDVADAKFDRSLNGEDQKISLPIIAADGRVIGAFCVGVRVDAL